MPIHTRAVMDFNFGSSPHMSDSCNILINFQNTGTAAVEWYVDSTNLNISPFFITIKPTSRENLFTLLYAIRNGRELTVIVLPLRMVFTIQR